MESFGRTKPTGQRGPRLFTIYQNIPTNPVMESKQNTTFWIVPQENFWEQRNIWKSTVLFFHMEYSKSKFLFHFFKAIFDTGSGLRGRFLVNGTDFYKS